MSRRFLKHNDSRQHADIFGIQVVRSVDECSIICTAKAQECVGFNMKQQPPIICELCRVPHDAPTSTMVSAGTWDHYAIIP